MTLKNSFLECMWSKQALLVFPLKISITSKEACSIDLSELLKSEWRVRESLLFRSQSVCFACSLNQLKAARFRLRSLNQSDFFLTDRSLFWLCLLAVIISRSYENPAINDLDNISKILFLFNNADPSVELLLLIFMIQC